MAAAGSSSSSSAAAGGGAAGGAEEEIIAQLERAEEYKQEGNGFFKAENFKKALGAYHKVFLYVNGLQMPGENSEAASYAQMMGRSAASSKVPADRVESVRKLKHSTQLNMAACYLKLGDHRKCIDACTKALAVDGSASKAFFRRGQAQLELRNLDEAKADFDKALALEPGNVAVEKELRRVAQAFAQHDRKERKKFAGMFNRMAGDDRSAAGADDAPAAEQAAEEAAAGAGGSGEASG